MIQKRIYSYFERNPQFHVLFIFDRMNIFESDLEGKEWAEGYVCKVFDGAWFNTKYAIENTWQKHFRTSPVYTITHNPERTLLNISVAESGLTVHHKKQKSGLTVHHEELQSGLSKEDGELEKMGYDLSGTAKDIVRLMIENPMITYNELSAKLGKTRSGIAKQIKKLIDDNIIQVSQVQSGRICERPRHAKKGQRAHSPGQYPGWVEAMKCALQGQKHGYETLVF